MKAKVYEATLETLKADETTRNNMYYLYSKVLQKLEYPTDLKQLALYQNKPSIESISRARRKIVEKFPSLAGTKEVEKERLNKTKEYIEFNNYGILED